MKKIVLITLMVCIAGLANAQKNSVDSLQEFTGKFKFPEGSPVTEITIILENGGLIASSPMGSSDLKRREGDVFEITAYGGTAIFKRNEEKKIIKLQVQVNDLDMEGDRVDEIKWFPVFKIQGK